MADTSHAELARVVRDHVGWLAAALVRVTGDFGTAEATWSTTPSGWLAFCTG
jgi:hypothetical protein